MMEVNGNKDMIPMKSCITKPSLLSDKPYLQCLRHEVKFLMTGDMNMLIHPKKLLNSSDEIDWDDSMAYLVDDNNGAMSLNNNCVQPLLKCGFVVTGCPKKVWALNLINSTIEECDLNNKWFQIENNMLLTKRNDLAKYRKTVQCAVEFGIDKVVPKDKSSPDNSRCGTLESEVEVVGFSTHIESIPQETSGGDKGEFCCSGKLCGKAKESTTFIKKNMICHKCCICNKAMHGGLCGAEASTILLENECTATAVICFLCIKKKGKLYLYLFSHL